MRHTPLKLLAFTSVLALGFATTNNSLAETQVVAAQLITNSAITLTAGDTIDFGTWSLVHPAAAGTNDITLTMNPSTGAVSENVPGGLSVAVEITAGVQAGSITVQTPVAATLDIFGSVTNDMSSSDTALALTAPTFSYAGGATTSLPLATGTATVASTGGADVARFGGLITIDQTPADLTHPGEISVTFTY